MPLCRRHNGTSFFESDCPRCAAEKRLEFEDARIERQQEAEAARHNELMEQGERDREADLERAERDREAEEEREDARRELALEIESRRQRDAEEFAEKLEDQQAQFNRAIELQKKEQRELAAVTDEICPNDSCRRNVKSNQSKCFHCGKPLQKVCVFCESAYFTGFSFCPKCGCSEEEASKKAEERAIFRERRALEERERLAQEQERKDRDLAKRAKEIEVRAAKARKDRPGQIEAEIRVMKSNILFPSDWLKIPRSLFFWFGISVLTVEYFDAHFIKPVGRQGYFQSWFWRHPELDVNYLSLELVAALPFFVGFAYVLRRPIKAYSETLLKREGLLVMKELEYAEAKKQAEL